MNTQALPLDSHYSIGIVGLGVMGRDLALNMADHGFSVVGYDMDKAKVEALQKESADHVNIRMRWVISLIANMPLRG